MSDFFQPGTDATLLPHVNACRRGLVYTVKPEMPCPLRSSQEYRISVAFKQKVGPAETGEEFTWHPRRSMEEFVRNRLSRNYGGIEEARRFVALVRSEERSFPALRRQLDLTHEISQNRQFNHRQRARWANLRAELARRISLL